MEKVKIKLKPCPFCGELPRLMYCENDGSTSCVDVDGYEDEIKTQIPAFVHCYECDMDYFPNTDSPIKVAEEWNKRKKFESTEKETP